MNAYLSRRRSCGIDVSAHRGLDVVVLDSRKACLCARKGVRLDELLGFLRSVHPDIVAVDAPSCFAKAGGSRACERCLARRGIHSYYTPARGHARGKRFYDWVRTGQRVFAVAKRAGYALYAGHGSPRGRVIEVFPHASAVVLKGTLPPRDCYRRRSSKQRWRREILEHEGVDTTDLTSLDLVDAALAALTGLRALERRWSLVGDSREGVIVVPVSQLRDRYVRE